LKPHQNKYYCIPPKAVTGIIKPARYGKEKPAIKKGQKWYNGG